MKRLAFAALVMFGAVGTAHSAGDVSAGQAKAAACIACHGADGNTTLMALYPKLGGQHASYLAKQLREFKSGARQDPTMNGMAAGLSEEDMADIAAFFSGLAAAVGSADAQKAAAGKKIYEGGDKARGISACMACHGPSGAGNPGAAFPTLGGQNGDYVVKALNDFRSGARANDLNGMMRDVAAKMSDSDIAAVAAYIGGLH
ncbi:MAG: cytochrome c4 [Gammaproteobacteria bacterium]|nr:cytochrome c4 [Gammaproteobacteria bacterium]